MPEINPLRYTHPQFADQVTCFTQWLDKTFADDPQYRKKVDLYKGISQRSFNRSEELGSKMGFEEKGWVLSSLSKPPQITSDLCIDARVNNGRPILWVAGAKKTVEVVGDMTTLVDNGEYMSIKAVRSPTPELDGVVYVEHGNRTIVGEQDNNKPFLVSSRHIGERNAFCLEEPQAVVFDTMKDLIIRHRPPTITK